MATVTIQANREGSSSPTSDAATEALFVTYRWMSCGLAVTSAVAYVIWCSPHAVNAIVAHPVVLYGAMIAQLGVVLAFGRVATRASTAVTAAVFFGYAALTGITFSSLFLVYTSRSIASTFLISAGTFGGLSAFGAVTRRDLSNIGRFGVFVLIGVIVASLANLFVRNDALGFAITVVGIVLFAALTAYDTQRLRRLFESAPTGANLPLIGALTLYLDFINLFLLLLRSAGSRRTGT